MTYLLLLPIGGLVVGFLLLRRVPVIRADRPNLPSGAKISIIIPARNEAKNLPRLLTSVRESAVRPLETLVIDDQSSDGTTEIAVKFGATVLASSDLPEGWTGKTWACHQGALAAKGDVLLFLDADTWLLPGGYERILRYFEALPDTAAVSLLPFHRTRRWYEELSLFFNIVMAMGAGGFGGLDSPHFFGQSLLLHKEMYRKAGGHRSVRGEVLENLHFAGNVVRAGGRPITLGGRHVLEMKMFPEGFSQLRESWRKAFAAGSGETSPVVLALTIFWLFSAMLTAIILCGAGSRWRIAMVLYLLNAIQIAWFGKQVGTFRLATAIVYPIPLLFYFVTFAQSMWSQGKRGKTKWRGREL